jgi:hypothetical protein
VACNVTVCVRECLVSDIWNPARLKALPPYLRLKNAAARVRSCQTRSYERVPVTMITGAVTFVRFPS